MSTSSFTAYIVAVMEGDAMATFCHGVDLVAVSDQSRETATYAMANLVCLDRDHGHYTEVQHPTVTFS